MTRPVADGYAEEGAEGVYPLSLWAGTLAIDAPVKASGRERVPGTERWFLVDERAGQTVRIDDAAR